MAPGRASHALHGVSRLDSIVGVDGVGNVVTSPNPTGGAAAWTVAHLDGRILAFSAANSASVKTPRSRRLASFHCAE
jgi:hypothetical protein